MRAAAILAAFGLVLPLLGSPSAVAGDNVWTALGPGGSQVTALGASAASPGVVYAGGSEGIWRSTDSGATWEATAPEASALWSVVVDPSNAENVVTGAMSGELWVSSDGGDHWAAPTSGPSGTALLSWNAAGLFAVVDGALYTSADGGDHWTLAGSPGGPAHSLLVVSATAIYVGSELGTVSFSDDGGATWEDRSSGIPAETEPGSGFPPEIDNFAVDPADPNVLYADVNPLGLYRSEDGGESWSAIAPPVEGQILGRVATLATTPTTLLTLAGQDVVRSTDGGATWTAATSSPQSVGFAFNSNLLPDPSSATTVYLGGFGVYRSIDAGDTFTLGFDGLGKAGVNALAADPGSPGSFLAATNEGVFSTGDDGVTWQHSSDGMHGQAMDIAADPSDPGKFFLVAAGDLWQSIDSGVHWEASDLEVAGVVRAVATRPGSVLVGAGTTIYRSADGGDTWTSSSLPLVTDHVNDVAVDPSDAMRIYAGTTGGLFRSATGGSSWTKIDTRSIAKVSVGPDSTAYALANGALAAFAPDGTSRPATSIGLTTSAYSLAPDADTAGIVYVGTPQGLYKSPDGGQRFVKLPTAGLDSSFFTGVVPLGNHLMAATGRGTASIDLSPLTASAEAATNVTASAADLSGAGNPAGSNADAFFEYGTTIGYGSTTATTPLGSGSDDVPVAATLSGLAHATTYHYRLVVQTSSGIAASPDRTFTTDFVAPSATTNPATQLTASEATVNGSVNPGGGATGYWFEYGLTNAYGSETTTVAAGSGKAGVAVFAALTGLEPATTYHYRLVAENAKGTAAGIDRQFTTTKVPPVVTQVGGITLREAALEGGAVPLHASWSATAGSEPICDYQVEIRTGIYGPNLLGLYQAAEIDGGSLPSDEVQYGVRARDCDTLAGDLTLGPPADLLFFEEAANSISRSPGWSRITSSDASGHRLLRTGDPGSSVSFKFTGRSVALIAPRGPHYGAVGVALDGGRFHRTSLYAASRTPQGLVYVLNLPTTGKHRIVVIARAVEGRHRVDIDAFTTLRD